MQQALVATQLSSLFLWLSVYTHYIHYTHTHFSTLTQIECDLETGECASTSEPATTTEHTHSTDTMAVTEELSECRCCGNVWDGNAQCYCMCYGCDKCTSPAPQPEPQAAPPSEPKAAAGAALGRVLRRLHETDKVQSSGIKRAQKRLAILEKRCQKLEAWIGREVAKKAA